MATSINTGYFLKTLSDELVANLHVALEERGYGQIRPSHGVVFQYIEPQGSRITDLAAKGAMTKQSMSALVYQLEQWGYLQRKPDATDKRAVLFVLTEKGQQVWKLGRSINKEFEKKWEYQLGKEQFSQFRAFLEQLTRG